MKAMLLAAVAAASALPAEPVFAWREGGVYQVVARPGRVTDLALEPGESLSATNPVAAGDTARWIIGDSESGQGPARRVHILVKPVSEGLATNLLIATDRRTYHLELRSGAGAYMAGVSWRYPEGELVALKAGPPRAAAERAVLGPPVPADFDPGRLDFGFRIEGDAPFRPLRVFDDGRRTIIDFPKSIVAREMPPIFIMSGRSDAPELVNFRVQGQRMIVDRLFDVAELRLGAGKAQARVRIVRDPRAGGQ